MILALGEPLLRRYRVTAIDRPGHLDSTRPSGDGSLATQARLVAGTIQTLGMSRPVLVGHSAGGALGLTMAVRHPETVAGVVAVGPLVFSEPRLELALFGPRGVPFGGHFAARTVLRPLDAVAIPLLWHAIFAPQTMPRAFVEAVPLTRLASAEELIATGEDALAYPRDLMENAALYPTCAVPVRILGGTADLIVNNRTQGFVLSRIMPDCTFESLPGIGHMLHHVHPERVVALVDELTAGSASGQDRAARRSSQATRSADR